MVNMLKLFLHFTKHLDVVYNLDIDNLYFESMFYQIYPPELQLKKANAPDTVSSKIRD